MLWCTKVKNRFQKELLGLTVVIFGVVAILTAQAMGSVFALDYGPQQVIIAVNDIRAQYGLPPYDVSQALMDIAQQQADYMAEIGRLTHDRPEGSGVPTTAENIAFGPLNRAVASWVDDQLHFDTITGWSTGQVGVGVAQGDDGLVYISLNMNRYSDSVFTSIPYTLQPGVTPQPVPTQASAIGVDSAIDATDNGQTAGALSAQEEAATYLLPEAETRQNYPVVSDIPVYLIMPENQSKVVEASGNSESAAYILFGVGAAGVIVSFVGLVYALRLIRADRKEITDLQEMIESTDKQKKDKSHTTDTGSSQEIPQEAQEE